jgi:RNA polymerase-binding transcription factor DksA
MKEGYCEICGNKIPATRLKVLPDTTTCVKCSKTEHYREEKLMVNFDPENQDRMEINFDDYERDDEDYNEY